MARPKLPHFEKRVKFSLTVSREAKEMAETIRIKKNISISTFVEDAIRREYKRLVKTGAIEDSVDIPGQLHLEDLQ